MESPLKFQQLNSELPHMKHTQEVSKSDLQAVKMWMIYFSGMFHVWQLRIKLLKFQWGFHFPYLLQWMMMIDSFGIDLNSIQW